MAKGLSRSTDGLDMIDDVISKWSGQSRNIAIVTRGFTVSSTSEQALRAVSFSAATTLFALFLFALTTPPARAEPNAKPQSTQSFGVTSVFQMPAYISRQRRHAKVVAILLQGRRYSEAESVLRSLIDKFPRWHLHHYFLAAALARQNKREAALGSLSEAIRLGFKNRFVMEHDANFETIRKSPRFQALLTAQTENARRKTRSALTPQFVRDGGALVDETNTAWEPRSNMLIAAFKFPDLPKTPQVYNGKSAILRHLNNWYEIGDAAGNHGDLYDNRDGGHSLLSRTLFPQLSHLEYGASARAERAHYGVNSQILFNAITFGNSSTALLGPNWRSQARYILTTPPLAKRAYQQYINNHLYVYPEHRDHDPGYGDLFPANTPYIIVSQGSSGSDQPFLQAIGATLAALRPEVKTFLRTNRLVAPTLQMILRSTLRSVQTDGDYLSAKAHPSVFESSEIDLARMIKKAHGLQSDGIPPLVHLAVSSESKPRPGINYFGPSGTDEILFSTPGAIARVVRATDHEKRMVITAQKTADPNGRPLKFIWKVLRGDPSRITIKPLNNNASLAEIRIPWHKRRPVQSKPALATNRVDIAVFANNGVHYSAPAFVSLYYPPRQDRQYDPTGRLLEIDYDAPNLADRYADPALFGRREWRDVYHYTDGGQLIGWDRFSEETSRRFTRHGAQVLETDSQGRPIRAERVRYDVRKARQGQRKIVEVPTGKFLTYHYDDTSDLRGIAIPVSIQ